MSDIDALSAALYAGGKDPLAVAEMWITNLLDARSVMRQRAANGIPHLPGWHDTSDAAVSRMVIGRLMEAGWRPPPDTEVTEAATKSREEATRHREWLATLPADQLHDALDHYATEGEWPQDVQPPRGGAA